MRKTKLPKTHRDAGEPSWKVIVSVLLFLHIVFVFVAVFQNGIKSQLFTRIATGAHFYTESLNFDSIVRSNFHLTHANAFEDDHHFEITQGDSSEVVRLPAYGEDSNLTGIKGGFAFQRYRNLARRAAYAVAMENDTVMAEIVRSIGQQFLPTDSDRVSIRLVGYDPEDWQDGAQRDLQFARDPQFYSTVYEADVWRGRQKRTNVHKRVRVGEAAPTFPQ